MPPRIPGFRIVRALGQGGFGTVWLADQVALERPVALKVLRPMRSDAGFRKRFQREARALALVQHAHVTRVFAYDDEGSEPWIAMELLAGGTLAQRIVRERRLAPDAVVQMARELLRGLDAVHAAGLTHRDVKPGNVLFAEDGRAVLADLGIARAPEHVGPRLTSAGAMIGTLAYLAPELFLGGEHGPAADLFAMGVTLHEALAGQHPTGQRPFSAGFRPGDYTAQLTGCPPALLRLIGALMHPDPRLRPPSAAAALDVIGASTGAAQADSAVENASTLMPAALRSETGPPTERLPDRPVRRRDTVLDPVEPDRLPPLRPERVTSRAKLLAALLTLWALGAEAWLVARRGPAAEPVVAVAARSVRVSGTGAGMWVEVEESGTGTVRTGVVQADGTAAVEGLRPGCEHTVRLDSKGQTVRQWVVRTRGELTFHGVERGAGAARLWISAQPAVTVRTVGGPVRLEGAPTAVRLDALEKVGARRVLLGVEGVPGALGVDLLADEAGGRIPELAIAVSLEAPRPLVDDGGKPHELVQWLADSGVACVVTLPAADGGPTAERAAVDALHRAGIVTVREVDPEPRLREGWRARAAAEHAPDALALDGVAMLSAYFATNGRSAPVLAGRLGDWSAWFPTAIPEGQLYLTVPLDLAMDLPSANGARRRLLKAAVGSCENATPEDWARFARGADAGPRLLFLGAGVVMSMMPSMDLDALRDAGVLAGFAVARARAPGAMLVADSATVIELNAHKVIDTWPGLRALARALSGLSLTAERRLPAPPGAPDAPVTELTFGTTRRTVIWLGTRGGVREVRAPFAGLLWNARTPAEARVVAAGPITAQLGRIPLVLQSLPPVHVVDPSGTFDLETR